MTQPPGDALSSLSDLPSLDDPVEESVEEIAVVHAEPPVRRRRGAHRASRWPANLAWIIAAAFGVVWLLIVFVRTQKPLPDGFVYAVLLIVLVSLFVRRRIWMWWRQDPQPTLVRWLLRAMGSGIGVGIVVAVPLFLVAGNAEQLSWFWILAIVGAVNGLLVGLVARLLQPDMDVHFVVPPR